MKNKILLKVKSIYGNNLVYPYCDISIIFSKLLRKKTFDNTNIGYIKQLGYEVNFIPL